MPRFEARVEDINKYAEEWKEAARSKDPSKFKHKSPLHVTQLKDKYGKKGYAILEYIILKQIKDPESLSSDFKAKLIKQLAQILNRRSLKKEVKAYKFPHQKMKQYEVSTPLIFLIEFAYIVVGRVADRTEFCTAQRSGQIYV